MRNTKRDREYKRIKFLFKKLMRAEQKLFPAPREQIDAPDRQGVYLIRSPSGTILHVGRTYRGRRGLAQRLKDHIHSSSSFTEVHLKGMGAKLRRRGYTFQYVEVMQPRLRVLLEAYATGELCPEHIGESLSKAAK